MENFHAVHYFLIYIKKSQNELCLEVQIPGIERGDKSMLHVNDMFDSFDATKMKKISFLGFLFLNWTFLHNKSTDIFFAAFTDCKGVNKNSVKHQRQSKFFCQGFEKPLDYIKEIHTFLTFFCIQPALHYQVNLIRCI